MKILVLGSSGMLGHKLIQGLSPHAEVWGTIRQPLEACADLARLGDFRCIPNIDAGYEGSLGEAISQCQPDVVINAIGIVKQLPTAKDVVSTLTINSILPHRLAQFSETFGFRLITVSTDCVFDGLKGSYTEDDRPNAVDLYGKSKELGEVITGNALTLRTSIIGRELSGSHSLVEWFLSNEGKTVKGFQQAIYSGFPTIVLADIIRSLIFDHRELRGLYHVSSEPINKYDLLCLLKNYYRADIKVEPSDDLRIDRSLDSSRFRAATGFAPAEWPAMIERMAADPTRYRIWK